MYTIKILKKVFILPPSKSGKAIAIIGYLAAAYGLFWTIAFMSVYFDGCYETMRPGVMPVMQLAFALSGAVAYVAMRWLSAHDRPVSKVSLAIATFMLLSIQTLFAVGIGFAVGTACTT